VKIQAWLEGDIVKELMVVAFILFPSMASGGQLDQEKISPETQWQPSSCHKPVPPSTKVYDVITYNVAVSQFNTYRAEVDAYFVCASSEAEQDYKIFRSILADSLEGIQEHELSQYQGLRSDLELSQKAFK
jgi:hypothetical protein